MLKKIILIENGDKYQVDTLEELVKLLIDKNYYEMSLNEKKEILQLKSFANCMNIKAEIITKLDNLRNIEGKFIAIDEVSYIYSLLILNKITVLESTDCNILTNELDKSKIAENYIIVNNFSKELLNKYLAKL